MCITELACICGNYQSHLTFIRMTESLNNAPVNRPPFLQRFVTNPFSATLHPMNPEFLLFSVKAFRTNQIKRNKQKTKQNKTKQKKNKKKNKKQNKTKTKNKLPIAAKFFLKVLKLPRFYAMLHLMTLFFGSATQWSPLVLGRKWSLMALDLMHR